MLIKKLNINLSYSNHPMPIYPREIKLKFHTHTHNTKTTKACSLIFIIALYKSTPNWKATQTSTVNGCSMGHHSETLLSKYTDIHNNME
jgi:hypothetical protein